MHHIVRNLENGLEQMFVRSIKKFRNPIFRSEYNFKLNERTLAVESINIKRPISVVLLRVLLKIIKRSSPKLYN